MKHLITRAWLPLTCVVAAGLLWGCDASTNPSPTASASPSASPTADPSPAARMTCVECHSDKDALAADLARRATDHAAGGGSACGGSVSRAAPADAVWVNSRFLESTHGGMGCVTCHGGVEPAADRDEAHSGDFRAEVDPEQACATCHSEIVENFLLNIHTKFNDLTPDDPEYIARAAFHIQRVDADPELQQLMAEGIEIACAECHRATCGSCHITLPAPSGGGFPNGATGHVFYGTPNTIYNCGACHGGRKAAEFVAADVNPLLLETDLGEITLGTSVHYNPGNMKCVDCHGKAWMHEQTMDMTKVLRHEDPALPTCEQCHVDGDEETFYAATPMHSTHATVDGAAPHLQCQVCHSQPYPNCASCHVNPGDESEPPPDLKFYTLKIAKNPFTHAAFYTENYPALGEKRPYEYSLVRRPSIVPDMLEGYAEGILSNYTLYPTWKYATPHNIQRSTLATAGGCSGCHENDDFYLTESYIQSVFTEENFPERDVDLFLQMELEANAPIVIER